MFQLLKLKKLEVLLLCRKLGFDQLCPYIEEWNEEETKPRLAEIIEYAIQSPQSWPEWYALYHHTITVKPTVSNVYYYPGMCFQRKYTWYWEKGFEYRYARRITVRAFLLCSQRVTNISADLQSYILSFILPQELGKEITTQNYNEYISKKKHYMTHCYRVNHCRVGHTINPHNGCEHCLALQQKYECLKVKEEMNLEGLPEQYQESSFENLIAPRLKLEMDLLQIKHEIKLERLMKRAQLRQYVFRTC